MMAARLGKMPTTSVRRLTSLLRRSCGLLLQICRQCSCGKLAKASTSGPASASRSAAWPKRSWSCSTTRPCWAQTAPASTWSKMERTRGGDQSLGRLGHPPHQVAYEVDPAALPAGARQHRRDGLSEAAVVVADHQPDA